MKTFLLLRMLKILLNYNRICNSILSKFLFSKIKKMLEEKEAYKFFSVGKINIIILICRNLIMFDLPWLKYLPLF